MDTALDLPTLDFRLQHAMALIRHDRWLLGAIHDGRLRVLTDSSPELHRPYRRTRPLTHLARRCLHERRPLTVTAVDVPADRRLGGLEADWELEWPALLYAPVGLPARRPAGLLILGCRATRWYQQQDIDYAAALGIALTGPTLALGGPLSRLGQREREAARLIAQGLSLPELAIALVLDRDAARDLVDRVLRKLSLRSPAQLVDRWPRLESMTGS